mgnify:CR=1 FL=1
MFEIFSKIIFFHYGDKKYCRVVGYEDDMVYVYDGEDLLISDFSKLKKPTIIDLIRYTKFPSITDIIQHGVENGKVQQVRPTEDNRKEKGIS